MKAFLAVFAVLVGCSTAQYLISPYTVGLNGFSPFVTQYAAPYAIPQAISPISLPISSQYHSQDELGQFAFGHSSPGQAREEVKSFDGTVRGSYSYVDPNGKVNQVVYKAGHDGFQILGANNLPVAPELPVAPKLEQIPDTPEVAAARADFAKKFEEVKEAALKAPEEIKSRRRRDTEEVKIEKPAELPTLTIPASRTVFNPFFTTDFYNPVLVKSVATPIASPLVSVLGKTTVKTSELKTIEDSKVPASTKLAEIKETEKDILTPISLHTPISYSALPHSYTGLPFAYNAHPLAYNAHPFAYTSLLFKR